MSETTTLFEQVDDASAALRSNLLRKAKRVVVKVGSAVLRDANGRLHHDWVRQLIAQIAQLRAEGKEVLLVSSGAVGSGLDVMKTTQPHLAHHQSLPDKQALAALGQSRLVEAYRQAFAEHKLEVAQVLLSRHDMNDMRRYTNARMTLERLLEWGVVPIINENDTTATEELNLGDNDELSAIVGRKMLADLVVIITTAPGVMTADPRVDESATLIPTLKNIDGEKVHEMEVPPDSGGRGGIRSKLLAASLAAEGGVYTLIVPGTTVGDLAALARGEKSEGTLILPDDGPRPNPIRRFLKTHQVTNECGRVMINDGAAQALQQRGASLLPVGVVHVRGQFEAGDVVVIENAAAGGEVARGIARYSSAAITRIKGRQSPEIAGILGYDAGKEVVHRDFMLLATDAVEESAAK